MLKQSRITDVALVMGAWHLFFSVLVCVNFKCYCQLEKMLSNGIIIWLKVILINITRLYGDPFCCPVTSSGKDAVAFEMRFFVGKEYFIKCS